MANAIDVVLLGARNPGADATNALAAAIAGRYGVPVDALLQRLAAGSFRVKSGTDLETANRYARDLESMGGRCELRDSSTGRVLLQVDPNAPEGLAAASESFSHDLGALDQGNLALATLDGRTGDTKPPPIGEVLAQPYDLATPPAGIPTVPQAAVVPAKPVNEFAPPSGGVDEEELMLAVDPRTPLSEVDAPPVARTMAAEPMPRMQGNGHPQARAQEAQAEKPRGPSIGDRVGAAINSTRRALAHRTRGAFVVGVVVAMLVGFAASHVIAVFQETDAYSSVRTDLRGQYVEATNPDAHAALAGLRANAVDLIESRQRRIAITGVVIWLLFAAGAAAIWFRVVPWERLEPAVALPS